jgi:hypothetical protein
VSVWIEYGGADGLRADLQYSSIVCRRAVFPLFYGIENVHLPQRILTETATPSLSHLDTLGPGAANVKAVFTLLRQRVMAVRYGHDPTERDVRTLINVANYDILDAMEVVSVTPEKHAVRTLLVGAHLFIYAVLWASGPLPWKGPLVQTLVSRLENSLQDGGSSPWTSRLPALLWALFIGTVITEEDECGRGQWFLSRLEFVTSLIGITNRMEFEDHLRAFVWDEEFGQLFLGDRFNGCARRQDADLKVTGAFTIF